MKMRTGAVRFQGNPLTLVGTMPHVGDDAPDATLMSTDLKPVRIRDFHGKVCVICSVPSLDTSVCDAEVRRFNAEAASLGADVAVLAVSMDLPFAQSRWCGKAGIKAVHTLSDYRSAAFGEAYGVLIQELRLLARAVFVVDRGGKMRYIQLVEEITDEPDYGAVLAAVREIAAA